MEQVAQPAATLSPADVAAQTVQNAVANYRQHHPEASVEQINAFSAEIEFRVLARQRPASALEMRKARLARSQAVGEKIKSHGLKTVSSRRVLIDTFAGIDLPREVSPTGGITLAYKIEGNQTILAAAVCSEDDNFDRLGGRELAVDRFELGLTLTLDTADLGEIDPGQIRRQYLNFLQDSKTAIPN